MTTDAESEVEGGTRTELSQLSSGSPIVLEVRQKGKSSLINSVIRGARVRGARAVRQRIQKRNECFYCCLGAFRPQKRLRFLVDSKYETASGFRVHRTWSVFCY